MRLHLGKLSNEIEGYREVRYPFLMQLYYSLHHFYMKNIIIILLLIPFIGFGQKQTTNKSYKDSTGNYIIQYVYDLHHGYLPTDGYNPKPHYDAEITVYRIRSIMAKADTIKLASFSGAYVPGDCFEDTPYWWVRDALKNKVLK